MPATYCPEKGDRRVTFFRDERYLVHTISDVTIKYSKGRMIRQQPEGHDTFASGDSFFCVAKVAPKDKSPDRAIKSDRAKVVMTAGCISETVDITNYIYDTRER